LIVAWEWEVIDGLAFFAVVNGVASHAGNECPVCADGCTQQLFLLAREPIYGLGEWAAACAPDALGLSPEQVLLLNDDRAGRWMTRLFRSDRPSLLLALLRHVVREFTLALDELHNESTTATLSGAYTDAAEEQRRGWIALRSVSYLTASSSATSRRDRTVLRSRCASVVTSAVNTVAPRLLRAL
jgi:hypothetical protein